MRRPKGGGKEPRVAAPAATLGTSDANKSLNPAEVYGPFTNEEFVGVALAPFRKQVVLALKFVDSLAQMLMTRDERLAGP